MGKKPKYCPDCGAKSPEDGHFCDKCGYKLVVTEVIKDSKGHIRKRQEIIESESPIKASPKLVLMPGERLLERHLDYYVSNKRLIKHVESLFGSKTTDYHYRHIKGLSEQRLRPFLAIGVVIGVILMLIGQSEPFFLLAGAGFIAVAFLYKKETLEVLHMDGGKMVIPNIKSKSGQHIANILRTQLYEKE